MVMNVGVVGDMQFSEIKSLAETAGAIANTLRLAIMMALRDMGKKSFNELLDAWYEVRGSDKKTGAPTRETLEKLGLKSVADDLEKMGVYKEGR